MTQSRSAAFGRRFAIGAVMAASLALAACSGGGSTPAPTTDPTSSSAPDPAEERLQVAYISFAVANTYDEPMLAEAQKVADANNIELTVFDGNLDPALQATLIEDVIASGQYDGMIVQPVYGPAIMDVVSDAIDAGITVVNIDQILGPDFTSGAAQIDGLAANVVFVGSILGDKLGQQTVEACAAYNLDPCTVAFLHDLKTSAVSIALWDSFQKVTAGTPVTVVAEGETFWNPAAAQTAVADILTANPDVDMFVTSDQGLQGTVLAIEAAGLPLSDYVLVGYGGAEWARQAIIDGTVYSDVLMAPGTTGRLGMEAMVKALRDGVESGDIDPFADFPNNGVITKDTADQFVGEWVG